MTENHEEQSTEQAQAVLNGQSTDEQLQAITQQLEEERKARADIEASVAAKDTRIQELEAQVAQAAGERESLSAELEQSRQAHGAAVARFREVLVQANPDLPEEMIAGETVDDLAGAVERGRRLAESVRQSLEARAAATRVPAGAPAQPAPSLEGLTSRQLIEQGISARRK